VEVIEGGRDPKRLRVVSGWSRVSRPFPDSAGLGNAPQL